MTSKGWTLKKVDTEDPTKQPLSIHRKSTSIKGSALNQLQYCTIQIYYTQREERFWMTNTNNAG